MPTSGVTMTGPLANAKVLDACWQIMQRQGLQPFDREGNKGLYWFISAELIEHEWIDGAEIAGIPVLLASRGGSMVELLEWRDGSVVRAE